MVRPIVFSWPLLPSYRLFISSSTVLAAHSATPRPSSVTDCRLSLVRGVLIHTTPDRTFLSCSRQTNCQPSLFTVAHNFKLALFQSTNTSIMFGKTSFLLATFAIAAQLASAQTPACLLAAVK